MPTADIGFVVLLLIHLGSVIIWLGSVALMTYAISPALPSAWKVLPRFGALVKYSSVSTLISGLVLFGYVFSVDTSLIPSGIGLFLLLSGAVLGLVAFIVAIVAIVPSTRKLLEMLRGAEPASSSKNEQKFVDAIRGGSRGVLALLVIVLILMVSGTYL